MNKIYKLEFETVSPLGIGRNYYDGEKPICLPEAVPEQYWGKVSRQTDNPWDQYNTLKLWETSGEHLIRNVNLFEMITEPEWKLI